MNTPLVFKVLKHISRNPSVTTVHAEDLRAYDGQGTDARVRILLRPWKLEGIDLQTLERNWQDAFDRAPDGVSVSRLETIARTCSSQVEPTSDLADAWYKRLAYRLNVQLHIQAAIKSGAEDRGDDHVLSLRGIVNVLPQTLLYEEHYRFMPTLLPDGPKVLLDAAFVQLEFDRSQREGTVLREDWLNQREYRHQLGLRQSIGLQSMLRGLGPLTLLIGDPGAGKSTLVNWIARQTILDGSLPFLLPLVVRLREYGLHADGKGLLAFALARAGALDDGWPDAVRRLAKHDRRSVLLLVDGFDELPGADPALKDRVIQEIQALTKQVTVILTSRPTAIQVLPRLAGCDQYRISELSRFSSAKLLERWCQHAGMADHDILNLRDHIDRHPDLERMVRNPFLLSCLCAIAHQELTQGNALPRKRQEIYQRCLDLVKMQPYPNQRRRLAAGDLRDLGRLAFWLLTDAPDAPRLVFDLRDVGASCGEAETFTSVVKPTRLISQWSVEDTSMFFTHTTFHEYLAAQHASSNGPEMQRMLDYYFFSRPFLEVLSFAAVETADDPNSLLWQTARSACQTPDRFRGVYLLLAHWLGHVRPADGGQALLGIDLREKLWACIRNGIHPIRFIAACAHLDAAWLSRQFANAFEAGEIDPDLRGDFQSVFRGTPLPEFSDVLLTDLFSETQTWPRVPFEYRMLPSLLKDLRGNLASDETLSERIQKRIIQVLGLARDHESIPLLTDIGRDLGSLCEPAIESIGLIGGRHAFEALDALLNEANQSGDTYAWRRAVEGLGNLHELRSTDRLLLELAQEDHLAGERVLEILRALQDHRIAEELVLVLEYLQSEQEEVRDMAANVMYAAPPSPEVASALAAIAQNDPVASVRTSALLCFEAQARPEDADWLEATVRNETLNIEEREAALMAFGDLIRMERCEVARGKALLAYALEQPLIGTAAVNLWQLLGNAEADRLIELGRTALEAPAEGPALVSEFAQTELCQVLATMRYAPAIDLMVAFLNSPDTHVDVKKAAAHALTQLSPEHLVDMTSDVANQALGEWSLATGRLVFPDGTILDPERGARPESSAVKIFLSYRRKDVPDLVGRVGDQLKLEFGEDNIFFDVESIPKATMFSDSINAEIEQCAVLLAFIGPNWVNPGWRNQDTTDPSIDPVEPLPFRNEDYVEMELRHAVKHGVPILPVRLNETPPPKKADLPEAFRHIIDVNLCDARTGPDFPKDVADLIKAIHQVVQPPTHSG